MADTPDPHIFDLTFKRLMHLSNVAVVNFINGLFGTKHSTNSVVDYVSTEHVNEKLKRTASDMVLVINGERYVIECQRRNDTEMALRVFVYCYSDAFENKRVDEKVPPPQTGQVTQYGTAQSIAYF
ncbi:MAG: hypothetical protein Ta2B_13040 [Termitinemataceae bacterium]|nr:MAG: hypothetical protein Ta2B_13040 [Termitinemataceae bacterium]